MKNLIRFDWAIKRLLRNKANFGILEGFLSELLVEDIKIESILESEGNKETADNKSNRVDLLVQNRAGELVIIEIQNVYQQDYLLRMLFGTSKLIVDNMAMGMPYSKVKKVISVHIVYFDLGKGEDYVYHGATNFMGIHKKDRLTLSPQEQSMYNAGEVEKLYPEYYIIKVNQFDDVAKDTLDEWIRFLKSQEIREGTQAKGLREAKDKLDMLHLTEAERREYDRYIANWRDDYGVVVGNYNKGKYEGAIEVAQRCLAKGLGVSLAAKLSGLSEVEINELITKGK
jgi:predicted transposase/invertase (TIGR01784 family)